MACLGSRFLLVLESVTAQSPGALRMGRRGNRGVVFSSSLSENLRFLLKYGCETCVDLQHECPKRGLWFLGRSHHCATLDLRPRPLGASSEHPAGVRSPVAARVPAPRISVQPGSLRKFSGTEPREMNFPFVSKYGVSHPLDLRIKKEEKKPVYLVDAFFFLNEAACIPGLTPDRHSLWSQVSKGHCGLSR